MRYTNSTKAGTFENYLFVTNLQGDIIHIYDDAGIRLVTYNYDAWGNHTVIYENGGASTAARYNPFRYRGYYYDVETGLYYLNSRYYDPQVGRFLNGDVCVSTGQGLLGHNMFAYCNNDPVNKVDAGGFFWETIFDVVSLAVSIVDVCVNPKDPLAWAGLAGDVVDLIPFVTGVGEVVDAVNISRKAAKAGKETVEAVYDTARTMDRANEVVEATNKGWRVGDDITNLTRAGNTPSWSTVRQRYWKNEAHFHPELYPNDLDRLKKGLAPIGEDTFSMELHHPFGREGDNFFVFEPLTQTRHRWIHYGG